MDTGITHTYKYRDT